MAISYYLETRAKHGIYSFFAKRAEACMRRIEDARKQLDEPGDGAGLLDRGPMSEFSRPFSVGDICDCIVFDGDASDVRDAVTELLRRGLPLLARGKDYIQVDGRYWLRGENFGLRRIKQLANFHGNGYQENNREGRQESSEDLQV